MICKFHFLFTVIYVRLKDDLEKTCLWKFWQYYMTVECFGTLRPDSMGSWKKIFDLNFGLGQNNTADYIYPRRPSILGNWELVKLWSSCCTYPGASFILFYVKKEDSRRESLLKAVLSYSLTITRCQERILLMLWPAWHAQKGEGQPSTQVTCCDSNHCVVVPVSFCDGNHCGVTTLFRNCSYFSIFQNKIKH